MPEQNFSNHTQRAPLFGIFLMILMGTFVGTVFVLFQTFHKPGEHRLALLIGALTIGTFGGFTQCRRFALKVQDRAIRAEENLRHYILTGKPLHNRLTIRQIVAVRFASDDQFAALAKQAAETGMAPVDIKKAVTNWRADFDRA